MIFNEIPSSVPGMRIWRAVSHNYSFVITLETNTGVGFEGYTGYTASWKALSHDITPFGSQPSNKIDGSPWKTFLEAELACKATLRQLRVKQ